MQNKSGTGCRHFITCRTHNMLMPEQIQYRQLPIYMADVQQKLFQLPMPGMPCTWELLILLLPRLQASTPEQVIALCLLPLPLQIPQQTEETIPGISVMAIQVLHKTQHISISQPEVLLLN